VLWPQASQQLPQSLDLLTGVFTLICFLVLDALPLDDAWATEMLALRHGILCVEVLWAMMGARAPTASRLLVD
jgi:hypothetical protein